MIRDRPGQTQPTIPARFTQGGLRFAPRPGTETISACRVSSETPFPLLILRNALVDAGRPGSRFSKFPEEV
jgi:hypothetical protein